MSDLNLHRILLTLLVGLSTGCDVSPAVIRQQRPDIAAACDRLYALAKTSNDSLLVDAASLPAVSQCAVYKRVTL